MKVDPEATKRAFDQVIAWVRQTPFETLQGYLGSATRYLQTTQEKLMEKHSSFLANLDQQIANLRTFFAQAKAAAAEKTEAAKQGGFGLKVVLDPEQVMATMTKYRDDMMSKFNFFG